MKIHYLQHVYFEGPAYIQTWAVEQGYELTGTQLFKGEALPGVEEFDALVVMGGPMGVGDEREYPWLGEEKAFIRDCISRQKKVLGICLGAQLIADALGAKVEPMAEKEIGWFPVDWSQSVRKESGFSFLPARQMVLHWHGDRFEFPGNALPLASSEGCDSQGFLIDDHVLGLQFHLEMTKNSLTTLIGNSSRELEEANGRFIQDAEAMLKGNYFAENHQIMKQLLNRFFVD
ncbi:type 1 glutamine amidotransferase [Aliifodinibius sp. S!AR15-10]|uniref:type 1 glutamine amidotransferase n=1 Tax=Aliifodinibius sp. S!AR15-10 TaxID=2950437 RepID=UPI002866F6CD|nr:type 1 glutamine amidotransferase [Aliifodinibius sp. S!AR15-10]MDR8394482.1 type 1 glutamine amidotransferase [Aliifodinibius sp. S!AR15-10]